MQQGTDKAVCTTLEVRWTSHLTWKVEL